jgi:hypothetical protein
VHPPHDRRDERDSEEEKNCLREMRTNGRESSSEGGCVDPEVRYFQPVRTLVRPRKRKIKKKEGKYKNKIRKLEKKKERVL